MRSKVNTRNAVQTWPIYREIHLWCQKCEGKCNQSVHICL